MTELNREMVEKVCRALCLHRGQDPDEMIQAGNPIGEPADYPAWMFGMPEVRTILTAILPDLREQHYAEERGRVVAWLRLVADEMEQAAEAEDIPAFKPFAALIVQPINTVRELAASIERGDHLTKEGE